MSLVVASYNIHGCVGLDGRADHERIVRVLLGLHADVIALQEVDTFHHQGSWRRHLEYFAEHTGMDAIAGPTLERPTGEYGNGLLTRLPVRETRRIEISVRKREPRGLIEAVLDGENGTGPVRVIATHLGLGAEERRVQVATICDLLAESTTIPVVLLGDFNEWLAFARAIRRIERQMGRAPAVRSFPSRMPMLALDRIWVRPASRLRAIEALSAGEAGIASDHLPVRAVVDL